MATITNGTGPRSLLSHVPLDILLQITYYLPTPDLGNLRRTCQSIESSLLVSFSREFFRKRQFMFTEFSLQALIDISKSRFSNELKHVIFSLEVPKSEGDLVRNSGSRSPMTAVQRNAMLQIALSYDTLLNTGQDIEMLAQAFSNLDHLETVEMRNFYSQSRRRDYPNVEWKSYGVSTIEKETGLHMRNLHHTGSGSKASTNRTFARLIRAIGKSITSGSTRPKRFEVTWRRGGGLNDCAFNFPAYLDPVISPALTNLDTLFLDLTLSGGPDLYSGRGGNDLFYVNGEDGPCYGYSLRLFLDKTTSLKHLRLNFRDYDADVGRQFLTWFSSPAVADRSIKSPAVPGALPDPPPPIQLLCLERLDLGMCSLYPPTLIALLRKYQSSLRAINLHRVILLHDRIEEGVKFDLWPSLFTKMSKLDVKLEYMSVTSPSQQLENRDRQHVKFKDTKESHNRTWAGVDIQSGLRDFISNTFVDRTLFDESKPIVVPNLSDEEDSNVNSEDSDEGLDGTGTDSDDN